MVNMAMASFASRSAKEIAAAAKSTSTMVADSWSQRMAQGFLAERSLSSLGPCSTRLRRASSAKSPWAGSTCSRRGSSSALS